MVFYDLPLNLTTIDNQRKNVNIQKKMLTFYLIIILSDYLIKSKVIMELLFNL